MDREGFGFGIKVTSGGHEMVAGHDTKGRDLDCLEAVNTGVGGERGPDRGGVLCNRTHNDFVGAEKRFFRLTPVGSRQGFEGVDAT